MFMEPNKLKNNVIDVNVIKYCYCITDTYCKMALNWLGTFSK